MEPVDDTLDVGFSRAIHVCQWQQSIVEGDHYRGSVVAEKKQKLGDSIGNFLGSTSQDKSV